MRPPSQASEYIPVPDSAASSSSSSSLTTGAANATNSQAPQQQQQQQPALLSPNSQYSHRLQINPPLRSSHATAAHSKAQSLDLARQAADSPAPNAEANESPKLTATAVVIHPDPSTQTSDGVASSSSAPHFADSATQPSSNNVQLLTIHAPPTLSRPNSWGTSPLPPVLSRPTSLNVASLHGLNSLSSLSGLSSFSAAASGRPGTAPAPLQVDRGSAFSANTLGLPSPRGSPPTSPGFK